MKLHHWISGLGLVLAFLSLAMPVAPAWGGPISFSFLQGTRAGNVDFVRSGSDLIVTLTNTSTFDALVPTDILTAIFFDIPSDPLLTRVSALVPLSSSVLVVGTGANVTPGDRNVGGEWAYKNNLMVNGNNQGVSSVGLNIFGPGDLFPGPDLVPPTTPDGINLGITSAGDNILTGNGGIQGQWLTKNAVVFTLSGYSGEPDADIDSVRFQYGTALDETSIIVPEPGTLVLSSLAVAGLAVSSLRRRRNGKR